MTERNQAAAVAANESRAPASTVRSRSVEHPDGSPSLDSAAADDAWWPDPATTAALVVDVQRLFTDMVGAPIEPPLKEVLPRIGRFVDDSRRAGATIVLVRTIIAPDAHSRSTLHVGTRLDEILRDRRIVSVIVLGLTTNVCVQSTARDAWQRDYQTITLADCCAEIGQGSHDASLAWTGRNFGTVCKSDEVSRRWRRRPSDRGSAA